MASGKNASATPHGEWIVGIDLGTTHTVVAASHGGASPEVFPIPQRVTAGEVAARALLPSCLYAPIEGETSFDPCDSPPWIAGEYARRRGFDVPGRFVASAKSWLCHAAVDRLAPILPWGADDESAPRISPLDASARYLAHVRRAWDEAHPEAPLADQEVVLTVPASFDEASRELTLGAAQRAGLTVRMLEEPQAAFYDYMDRAGKDGLAALLASTNGKREEDALVLVCDVGGGTTDLSLIRVARASVAESASPFEATRIAVGRHVLLGGDNMDLALAHACEARLSTSKLDASRFAQLVLACRAAKEALLGVDAPADVGVSVVSSGARLVGGTLSTRITREEAESIVLDGFFPRTPRDAEPQRARSGLVASGLPYERDVAITRHIAAFMARHAKDRMPTALLLNGGVFHAKRITERLAEAIDAWSSPEARGGVAILPHADPDLAVARGAVAYALARRGLGVRIESGAARGYYVEVAAPVAGEARTAVCVVPRGAKEGVMHVARDRPLGLVVGRPVRFELYASDDARGHAAGDVVTIDDAHFDRLPPVAATFGAPSLRQDTAPIRVVLEGELTAIGTLDLACVEIDPPNDALARRFRLAFALHGEAAPMRVSAAPPSAAFSPRKIDEARDAIDRVFGKGNGDAAPRLVKDLVRDLEKILGDRPTWTIPVARAIYDAVWLGYGARRRSLDHERIFWQLAGYCLRPGFGDPLDASRVAAIAPLAAQKLAFPDQARGWQQFWIAWRRVAAGLDGAAQLALRDMVDPYLAPAEKKIKRPKGAPPQAEPEMLDMVSSLERVPAARRSELGAWILERTWTDRDPRLWSAIGRLGARVPAYASLDHVVGPLVVERWIDHLSREKWDQVPTAAEAAVRMARVTGDRARDVSERVRREIARRLTILKAPPEWIRAVTERVDEQEEDRLAFFGEAMPVGLRFL